MEKHFYAVKVGRNPGIYKDWDECYEQVNQFSNSEYKKFNTYAEANAYMGQVAPNNISVPRTLVAFIGSARYIDTLAFGIVCLDKCTNKYTTFSAAFSNKSCKKVAKWAPFFCGCYFAIKSAFSNSYQQVIICSNASELKQWGEKGYGGYTHMAKKFKEFISAYSSKINIFFSSGHHYSEELTELAYILANEATTAKDNFIENPLI